MTSINNKYLKKFFKKNDDDIKNYKENYLKVYSYYENKKMSLDEINVEISRLESQPKIHSNPGIGIFFAMLVMITGLFLDKLLSISNIAFFSALLFVVSLPILNELKKISIDIKKDIILYSISIQVLNDIKSVHLNKKMHRRRSSIK